MPEGKGKQPMKNDFLDTDYTKVNGQNYALISIASPSSNQKYDKLAIKLKGCFDTIEHAKSWANKLQQEDDTFDIFVVDMYSWLLIPPEIEKIDDVHYRDDMLNKIIGGKIEEDRKAQSMFQQYQRDMRQKADEEKETSEDKEEDMEKIFSEETPLTSSQQKEEVLVSLEPLKIPEVVEEVKEPPPEPATEVVEEVPEPPPEPETEVVEEVPEPETEVKEEVPETQTEVVEEVKEEPELPQLKSMSVKEIKQMWADME